MLECQCCGYAYYGKRISRASAKGKIPYAYYRCVGTDAYRFGGRRVCENKQVRTDKLDEAVWRDACELLRHPQLLRKEYERRLAAPSSSTTDRSLTKQLAQAQQSVNRLIDAYADGVLERTEFEPRIARARKRLSEVQEKLDAQQSQTREQCALREALTCLDQFAEAIQSNLDQADWQTRREILRTIVDRVLVEPDQIRIVYRINFPLFAKRTSNVGSDGKSIILQFCWRRDLAYGRCDLIVDDQQVVVGVDRLPVCDKNFPLFSFVIVVLRLQSGTSRGPHRECPRATAPACLPDG